MRITKLELNEVFVFGSNEAGRHGKGAAKQAMKFGAIYGNPEGHQGSTYAIPTKDSRLNPLPIYKIKVYVDRFIWYAQIKHMCKFYVTKIGCGLAGYTPEQIAPLFKEALYLDNVILPEDFIKSISKSNNI